MSIERPSLVEVRQGTAHFAPVAGKPVPTVTKDELRASVRADVEREVAAEADPMLQQEAIRSAEDRWKGSGAVRGRERFHAYQNQCRTSRTTPGHRGR